MLPLLIVCCWYIKIQLSLQLLFIKFAKLLIILINYSAFFFILFQQLYHLYITVFIYNSFKFNFLLVRYYTA